MKTVRRLLSAFLFIVLIPGCQANVTPEVSFAKNTPLSADPSQPASAAATLLPTAAPTLTAAFPGSAWVKSSPEQQGIDSAALAKMFETIETQSLNLRSLLIVRNGKLVTEAYFHPYQADTPLRIQSITKSVMGLLIGIAIDEGQIKSVDQPILDYFPGRLIQNLDQRKREITIRDLLTMTSGFDCDDGKGDAQKMMQSTGWVQFMLDLPMAEEPGKVFHYCSGNAHLLSVILQKATGQTAREFANARLFPALGIAPVAETAWVADPQGYSEGSSGLYLTPQQIARIGLLVLNQGRWDGKQIVSESWVRASMTPAVAKGDGSQYGYLWTLYPEDESHVAAFHATAFHAAALGMGGQQIHLFPEQHLVVVLTSGLPIYDQIPAVTSLLNDSLLPAVKANQALPEQPEAEAQLQRWIEQAAEPRQPAQALPELAKQVSGKAYRMDQNPLGYQTVSFQFDEGSSEAKIVIDDQPPFVVGMDHLFREYTSPNGGSVWMRGRWLDDQTFELYETYLGELGDLQSIVHFTGNEVAIEMKDGIFGQSIGQLHGTIQ